MAGTYRWTYEFAPPHPGAHDAEWWARRTFERLPRVVRTGLVLGWRFPLALRLGPGGILGWRVSSEAGGGVRMTAEGPLCTAANIVRVVDAGVVWTTVVEPKNRLGRVVWAAAAQVHERTLPLMLRHAAR
jgi:hypothetical protein